MNKLAPIALFVYNRLWHTQQTVEALKENKVAKESELFIFSDAPKSESVKENVEKVREYIKTIDGFKEVRIIERDANLGLANSIISGVTEVINNYGRTIILEDDIIVNPNFLEYMNQALNIYEYDERIFSITGYNHSPSVMKIPKTYKDKVYLFPRASSWGWATWRDRWESVDWEVKDFQYFIKDKKMLERYNFTGEDKVEMLTAQMRKQIDSWAIRWDYHHFKNSAFCIYPVNSLVKNIGFDGSGVHCKEKNMNNDSENFNEIKRIRLPKKIELNVEIVANFRRVYKKNKFKEFIFNLFKETSFHGFYLKLSNCLKNK